MSCHGDWVNSGDLISHESPKTYVNFTAYSKGKQENKKTKKELYDRQWKELLIKEILWVKGLMFDSVVMMQGELSGCSLLTV